MSASKSQRQQQTILTEDGELRESIPSAEPQAEPLFCTNCGTANKPSSRFCRKCGQSLDDQVADLDSAYHNIAPENKGKRSQSRVMQSTPQAGVQMNLWMMIFQLMMMLVMGALTLFTAQEGLAGVSIIVLFMWFMVEAAIFGVLK
jgi:hypothetical protein